MLVNIFLQNDSFPAHVNANVSMYMEPSELPRIGDHLIIGQNREYKYKVAQVIRCYSLMGELRQVNLVLDRSLLTPASHEAENIP
jgi:hypothetical protein